MRIENRTQKAFEYQWKNLQDGAYLLTDKRFKEGAVEFLTSELGIDKKWFKGKNILDAGCGGGRWSYGFLKLGANVTAIDYAKSAVDSTLKNCSEFSNRLEAYQIDILEETELKKLNKKFDMIFSWGVLHHTGNTKKAFENLVPFLKPNSIMHVYIYGRWSLNKRAILFLSNTFLPILNLNQQKWILAKVAPKGRLHTFFDTLSPKIADTHTDSEVISWFRENNFANIKRIYPSWCPDDKTGLHIQGVKT
jgi:2-polyprenyl-3-methyl-5-hydroxy-6-metoxy-1,4-benzoquinol methylase